MIPPISPRSRFASAVRRSPRRTALLALACLILAAVSGAEPSRPASSRADASRDARDEVLTLEEAAELLEVAPELVATLAEAGTLPGRRLGPHWRFNRARLLEWLAEGTAPAAAVEPEPLPDTELDRMRAAGPESDPRPEPDAAATGPSAATAGAVGEAPEDRSASDVFLRSRRVLLAPKQLVIEPLVFYTRADTPDIQFQSFSSSAGPPISAAVGKAANIEQNMTTASLTGRIGLADGLEGNTGLIFQDRRIESDEDPDEIDTELRSIFLGLRKAVLREARLRPELVVGLQGIAPLGDSSLAVGMNVFAVKSADPIAMFAGLEYLHTFSRNFEQARKLEPEDTFGAQLGYVFAVTDQTSLNSSIQGFFVLDSSFDAGKIHSTEQFSLRLGVTQRLSPALYVEPSVAFGLDGPGDFVTFGLRLPWIVSP